MARALRLLAQREHSRAELERKLLRPPRASPRGDAATGLPVADDDAAAEALRAEVARTLDQLERGGWLDDHRAAEALLQAKAQRYGGRRLGALMRARAFDPDLVTQALAPMRDSEFDRARALWQRRFGQPAADPRDRQRQLRFLLGRGFDPEVASRVVRSAGSDDEADAAPPDDAG